MRKFVLEIQYNSSRNFPESVSNMFSQSIFNDCVFDIINFCQH